MIDNHVSNTLFVLCTNTVISLTPTARLPVSLSLCVDRVRLPHDNAISLGPGPSLYHPMASSSALFQLAAHTDRANKLVERLYYSQISQSEYDAQILATSITSPIRAKSVPIVLTLDDTLATVINHANQAFKFPLAEIKSTQLFVQWAKKTFKTAGEHRIPRSLLLLDEENLEMALKFMKASSYVEQLIVEFEAVKNPPARLQDTVVEATQAEDEEDDRTPTQEEYRPLDAKDKKSPERKEQAISEKGKERETYSNSDRRQLKSMISVSENLNLLAGESNIQTKNTKQPHTQQESHAKKESRHSSSSHDRSRKPSKGHLKDESRKSGSSPDRSRKPTKGHSKDEGRKSGSSPTPSVYSSSKKHSKEEKRGGTRYGR